MLHWPYITNCFKGCFSICSTNLHRRPLWHFIKANKHMLTTKNCCSSTWLFDWGINSPFVHQKRGYLFSCASFSWAPQFMPFPVMLHGTWRMSTANTAGAEPCRDQPRISSVQGQCRHLPPFLWENSAAKQLPGPELCGTRSAFWKLQMPFWGWEGYRDQIAATWA